MTTSNIVADWVQKIGGDRVDLFSLLPVTADPHTFQPGARDMTRVADSDITFSVGLDLEADWLDDLIENAAADSSRIIALGEFVNPSEFGETQDDEDEHDQGTLDPHFWFDPVRVKAAVSEIASQLSAQDPSGSEMYQANTDAYLRELDQLHTWIQEQVRQIPEERRLLVTSHDSLGYFAERYDFRVVGTVIPDITTDREPSAKEMTELIDEITEHRAPAIFTETTVSDRLARTIAEEADIQVVTSLYTGSVGTPESGAGTYIDMMRSNVEIIVEALK